MPTYTAPVKDMDFILHDLLKLTEQDVPGYADLDRSFTQAILDEAGKLASEVLAPLNPVGDREGCRLENGVVYTPTGFKAAFEAMKEGGWTCPRNSAARTCPMSSARRLARCSCRPTWPSTCIRA
jgi:acyl-CoA dehydrogenase